jgi:chaperonin GroES
MRSDLKLSSGDEYILIREDDVIGVMPRASEFQHCQ